jgi:hypothetical protein
MKILGLISILGSALVANAFLSTSPGVVRPRAQGTRRRAEVDDKRVRTGGYLESEWLILIRTVMMMNSKTNNKQP